VGVRTRRSFGGLRQLPSGRWQAQYTAPDGLALKAPSTFAAKDDAVAWLAAERRRIDLGTWTRKSAAGRPRGLTVRTYADRWWAETVARHKPRTRVLHRGYLDQVILPELGDTPLAGLTVAQVRAWYAGLDAFPARNANAYSLLRTILNQAVDDELIAANPCRVKRAAVKTRVVEPVALSAAQIRRLADAMPPRWQALVLLAGFSGLRFGELTALRPTDLALGGEAGVSVTVARAVVRVGGAFVVGAPKSRAALRTVPLPDALGPVLAAHMTRFGGAGRDGLVFPAEGGGFLHRDTIKHAFKTACVESRCGGLRFHDLRHSAATLFAQAGATPADHMTLMGHTSPTMSARYTHSTATRTRELAQQLWT
jgi:integrase